MFSWQNVSRKHVVHTNTLSEEETNLILQKKKKWKQIPTLILPKVLKIKTEAQKQEQLRNEKILSYTHAACSGKNKNVDIKFSARLLYNLQ
jgi:hypothetical protein